MMSAKISGKNAYSRQGKKECTKAQRAKEKHSKSQELEIMCHWDGGTSCKEVSWAGGQQLGQERPRDLC